jgi:Flp pilus assembly protein TadG
MSLIYVTTGFLSFFAATTLAVDVGMLMTARSQAQNAADSGALAGAIALALDDFDDRSAGGPAVQAAVNAALENSVIKADVAVEPGDVTFPLAPNGEANRVRVAVYRTGGRNNPLSTFIAAVFGMDTANITAMATAEAALANAMTCVRPFTIPDRWDENQDADWTVDSTFDRYDNQGDLVLDADEYILPGQDGYQGYDPNNPEHRGLQLTLRAGTGNNIQPTFYYSWKMSEAIGGSFYEDNIRGCNHESVELGQVITQEPGNMVGPTSDGIDDLIAQDPSAYWDGKSVKSPLGRSPRIFPIPLYNPDLYDQGKINGRNATLEVANWIGFFVESRTGNEVKGRIVPILGVIDPNAGPAPEGTFPRAVRLVQ